MDDDNDNDRETRRLRRDEDTNETGDPVEDAIREEMLHVRRAREEANGPMRKQFNVQLRALQTKLAQHQQRRERADNLVGDPYHRTADEVQAESARLGAHH